jgi:hypothetical protein
MKFVSEYGITGHDVYQDDAWLSNPGSPPSPSQLKAEWWSSLLQEKKHIEDGDKALDAQATLVKGVVSWAVSELLLAEFTTVTLYRAMSEADFAALQVSKTLRASKGETMISPTAAFSTSYRGVLVEFRCSGGVLKKLEEIGLKNFAKEHPFTDMPLVNGIKWKSTNAFFKYETNKIGLSQVNIGLGNGEALRIFNSSIKSFKAIPKPH